MCSVGTCSHHWHPVPILVFSSKCQLPCTVLGCKHKHYAQALCTSASLMGSVSDSLSRNMHIVVDEPHYLSSFCGHRLMPPLGVRALTKSNQTISQKGWEQRSGLWSPPAEPLLYWGCLADCLSFPSVVCSICTTAGEIDSQSELLPNWTGWFHRSVIDLKLHCVV